MDLFYIDRQFGQPIFIDVEKGIVQRVYNENFNNKMNEVYKGKEISFLKTDFEEKMKGSYHNVRPLVLITIKQKILYAESNIKVININLSNSNITDKSKISLEIQKKESIKELSNDQNELKLEIERIKTEHNYKFL